MHALLFFFMAEKLIPRTFYLRRPIELECEIVSVSRDNGLLALESRCA